MRTIYRAISIAIAGSMGSLIGTSACTAPPFTGIGDCDPNALFPSDLCRAQADAGSDADADPEDAGPDAPDDAPQNLCPGQCVPVPSGGEQAGLWSDLVVSLWVGPKELVPNCCPGEPGCDIPGDVPNEKFRLFDMPVAPPAACEPCECGAEGECTEFPETIEIRAGTCAQSGLSSLPFNGPAGWDGSCSSDGALPAGALCNGSFCAQSVWASPLPGPTSEACKPKSTKPKFTVESATWQRGALACYGNTRDDDCGAASTYCVNDPGPGWQQCVFREGVYTDCPANYLPIPYVMYVENALLDERGCEACSCGQPAGSGCLATMHVYSDSACGVQASEQGLSSFVEQCGNVSAPGSALGGKAITDLGYMPGTCSATGGEPTGTAKGDALTAVSFCCAPSFYDLK